MNIVLGILVLIFATFMGYVLSQKYNDRTTFYEDFSSFNNILKLEMNFTQKKIKEILEEYNSKSEFYFMARNYFYKQIFPSGSSYLTAEDIDFVCEYFKSIGNTDKYSQMCLLDKMSVGISDKLKDATEKRKKYKNLYVKLGFLVGLTVFVLLL